jgi:hypothetical protein
MIERLSHKARRKILGRLAHGERVVLVPQKDDQIRVFNLERYQSHQQIMRTVIQTNKPWAYKQKRDSVYEASGVVLSH